METPTDCLVLLIREYDYEDKDYIFLDNTIFVLYDTKTKKYIIRGRRNTDSSNCKFFPYSFSCKSEEYVYDFINNIIDKYNSLNIDLLNYDNLPAHSDNITFDFLKGYIDRKYEIIAYDNCKFKKSKEKKEYIINLLTMMKHVKNDY